MTLNFLFSDRQDSKLFRFITPSPIGGLTLGFVVTSSETQLIMTEAFKLFQSLLPKDAFYKRGPNLGPALVMSDDCEAQLQALTAVWPQTQSLLCTWHLLNSNWRWLFNGSHGILKADRPTLLILFRKLVYAQTYKDYDTGKPL